MSTPLVKPIKCRRCKGTGEFGPSYVDFGICKRCSGSGVEEGDKATLQAAKKFVEDYRAAYQLVQVASWDALMGFRKLEVDDPARFRKALASVLAGHPKVMEALAAYAHAE